MLDLCSKSRKKEIVEARQIAHYLAKKYTELSLAKIGVEIGRKNHATVLYSDRVVKDVLSYSKGFIIRVGDIEKEVKQKLGLSDPIVLKKKNYTITFYQGFFLR